MNPVNAAPPRENLTRAITPGLELRSESDDGMPTLISRFSVFNEWTEIDSWFEGRFMERIAPGAFKKTMRENRSQIKPLFQHGHDPQIGSKPLGAINDLREDGNAAVGEVKLLDTSYVRDLIPGLEAGLYGSSFRFQVVREDVDKEPKRSDHNPDGLPERTIKEVRLFEFGPVTFPAYASATAGVRSLTDEMLIGRLLDDPEKLRELLGKSVLVGERGPETIVVPKYVAREEPDPKDTVEEIDEEIEPAETEAQTDQTDEAPPEVDAEAEPHLDEGRREFEFWFVGAEGDLTPTPYKRRRERLFVLTEQS